MEYTELGNTGLKVSRIALGCMSLRPGKKENEEIIDQAIDNGINLLDTADLYNKGANEELVRRAIRGRREKIILATKVGNQWREDGEGWNWNPRKEYILSAVEKSLKRLGTDHIDLYQLHGGTIEDPIEECIEAFEQLQKEGKIIHYGISSIRPNVIRRWLSMARPATVMLQYSLLDRRAEEGIIPLLEKHNTGILVRGAVAQGLLIDKPARPYLDHDEEKVRLVQEGIASASSSKRSRAQTAVQFVLKNKTISSVVAGISTVAQLKEIMDSLRVEQMDEGSYNMLKGIIEPNQYKEHR